jgi:fructuronate reductase
MTDRLSRASIPSGQSDRLVPPIDRPDTVGIVHLGLGAFARAHQIQYTEGAAAATGDRSWGVLGVTGRRPDVAEALAPQDGLYGVLVRSEHSDLLRLTGSIVDVAAASEAARVVEALAAPTTRIITMTITEKAYTLNPPSTPLALLGAGLRRRFEAGGAPVTVMSCDNLAGNGRVLRALVLAAAGGGPLSRWIAGSVRFPSSMVDRIVPATSAGDRRVAESISGRTDAGLVVAEPFTQWVIEDDFAAERPQWERAGAVFTNDIAPYEEAKLRLLNGTHSLLAYGGSCAGHRTIQEAVSDPALAALARELQREARRTLLPPAGLDLEKYCEQILRRFANPALRHTTRQVAMDGSRKLPMRIVGTCVDGLRSGAVPHGAAFAVAAWIAYVSRASEHDPSELEDPMAERLCSLVDHGPSNTAALVRSFLASEEIFPQCLRRSDAFVNAVSDHLEGIRGSDEHRRH